MKSTLIFKSFLAFIILSLSVINAQISDENREGFESITKEEINNHLSYLADDALKGRPAGSDECKLAAMYIAKEFYKAGLKPFFSNKLSKRKPADLSKAKLDQNSFKKFKPFFQSFNIQKSQLAQNNKLSFTQYLEDGFIETEYEYGSDFFVNYKGLEDVIIKSKMVFVGYGIEKGEDGYNDYLDSDGDEIDVKNKIVVIVDDHPRSRDSESDWVKARNNEYRLLRFKGKTALQKGALAVLVIPSPFGNHEPVKTKLGNITEAFQKGYTKLHEAKRNSIPLIYLTRKASIELLKNFGSVSLVDALNEIDETLKSNPFTINNADCKLKVDIDYEVLPTQNVVGFIEGSDPELKDEIVVFGAHYDHIGLGYYGAMDKANKGKIHNGADDNASGTAGLIEVAEAFAKNPPKRSTIFIAFSAEENGILGSRYYVYNNPLKPLDKTVAMINMDMISRNETELIWIGGVFQGRDIIETVKEANKDVGFELLYNVGMMGKASDQVHFLNKKIPSIFLFAGLHDDYHMPEDDIEKINFPKAENVTKLAYATGWILANQDVNPKYEDRPISERAKIVKESNTRLKKIRKQNKSK